MWVQQKTVYLLIAQSNTQVRHEFLVAHLLGYMSLILVREELFERDKLTTAVETSQAFYNLCYAIIKSCAAFYYLKHPHFEGPIPAYPLFKFLDKTLNQHSLFICLGAKSVSYARKLHQGGWSHRIFFPPRHGDMFTTHKPRQIFKEQQTDV